MSFADTLKMIMGRRNMKSVELSRASGLSESIISEYLSGKKEPRGRQSIEIARALGVSLDELWETGFSPESSWDIADHIKKYRLLNEDGQHKTDAYMDDLLGSDRYRQKNLDETIQELEEKSQHAMLVAAAGGDNKIILNGPSAEEIQKTLDELNKKMD